jgi:beta-N-acetylglucosaminidase
MAFMRGTQSTTDKFRRAAQENEVGELYLTNVDFLKNGVPASVIATLVSIQGLHSGS